MLELADSTKGTGWAPRRATGLRVRAMKSALLCSWLALMGCRTAVYAPETPRTVVAEGVRFELREVRLERSVEMTVPLARHRTLRVRLAGQGLASARDVYWAAATRRAARVSAASCSAATRSSS